MKTRFLLAFLALAPVPAVAHVDLAPENAGRGETVDLALIIGHGCKGAPITGLRLALPPAFAKVSVPEKPGWTATVHPDEIRWQGGPLPDHTKERFVLRATIAADAPAQVVLPVIQICGDQVIRWIETAPDADSPAPVLGVTAAK